MGLSNFIYSSIPFWARLLVLTSVSTNKTRGARPWLVFEMGTTSFGDVSCKRSTLKCRRKASDSCSKECQNPSLGKLSMVTMCRYLGAVRWSPLAQQIVSGVMTV